MTHEAPQVTTGFVLDGRQLTKSAITMIRVAFGIGGRGTRLTRGEGGFLPSPGGPPRAR